MKIKNTLSTVLLSVFLSALFVAATVYASTTISTNIVTNGTLQVDTTSTLTGAVTMGSTLSVTGLSSLSQASSTMLSAYSAYFGGTASTTISSTGAVSMPSTLSVTGLSSLGQASSTMLSAYSAYFGGTATTTVNSAGLLTTANASTTYVSVSGSLMVNGNATTSSNGNIATRGDVSFATASSTGLVKMNSFTAGSGTTVEGLLFGTCTPSFGTVTASSTKTVICGSANLTGYEVFVTPYITNNQIIFSSASSTASGISVAVYNTGVTGDVVTTDNAWSWMAVK